MGAKGSARMVPASPAGGGGGGWPTDDGTGAGNLTAETAADDTVGYNFTDNGIGGFTVETAGTGGQGVFIEDTSPDGAGASVGSVNGQAGLVGEAALIVGNGSDGVLVHDQFASGGGSGIVIHSENNTIAITSGPGSVIIAGLPAADPHVVGALYTTAGVLHVSAG